MEEMRFEVYFINYFFLQLFGEVTSSSESQIPRCGLKEPGNWYLFPCPLHRKSCAWWARSRSNTASRVMELYILHHPGPVQEERVQEMYDALLNNILFCKIAFNSGNNRISQLGHNAGGGGQANESLAGEGCPCH